MDGRSSLAPEIFGRIESLEGAGFRCRGTGAAAICWPRRFLPSHLPERQPAGVSAVALNANIWRLSLSGPGSGQRTPNSVHCLHTLRIRLHNTLPTANELPLNPLAVESRAFGSVMRTAPTPRNCFHWRRGLWDSTLVAR